MHRQLEWHIWHYDSKDLTFPIKSPEHVRVSHFRSAPADHMSKPRVIPHPTQCSHSVNKSNRVY